MDIGTAISGLDRSSDERERILNLIKNREGICWRIFEKYAEKIPDNNFWNKTQDFLKIKGFRAGAPRAKQLVVQIVLDRLLKKDKEAEIAFWKMYSRSVTLYFDTEYRQFNDMLATNKVVGSPVKTEDIFSSIMLHVDLYEIGNKPIEELYECFWFKRIENFNELITKKQLTVDLVKKLIARSKSQIESQFIKDKAQNKEIENRLESFKMEYENSKEEVNQALKKIENNVDLLSVEFQNQIANIVSKELEAVKKSLSKHSSDGSNNYIDKEVLRNLEKRFQLSLSEITHNWNKKLLELESKVTDESKIKASLAPVIDLKNISYSDNLKKIMPYFSPSPGLDIAISAILLSNQCFIFSSRTMVKAIFNSFFERRTVIEITAAPSWIELEDLTKHLNEKISNKEIVVIYNFDQGYIESYLLPYLNSVIDFRPSLKIVLVPTGSDVLNSKVMSVVLNSALFFDEALVELINVEIKDKDISEESFIVSNSEELVSVDADACDLKNIIKNIGATIDDGVFSIFCRQVLLLKDMCLSPRHIRFGYKSVLDNYLFCKYGSSKRDLVFESIRGRIEA